MKKSLITKFVLPIALVGGLSGCTNRDFSQDFTKHTDYKGYDAIIYISAGKRKLILSERNDPRLGHYLSGEDRNNDERFDSVHLNDLPKGHPLEQYASLDSLEKVYNEIKGATQ